jgi:regulator of cell morphogenesis and NO signaling
MTTSVMTFRQHGSAAAAAVPKEQKPAALGVLCDHIERTHHAYLHEALPRLMRLADEVIGSRCCDERGNQLLRNVRNILEALREEMEAHMRRSESAFFPLCRELDRTAPCSPGLVGAVVRLMSAEDDDAREALTALRALTNNFVPPADAGPTYRDLLAGLQELDADLRRHIDEEKNLIFPRALAAAAAAAA